MRKKILERMMLALAISTIITLIAIQNVKKTETNISFENDINKNIPINDLLQSNLNQNEIIEKKSYGINMHYIDLNTGIEISPQEKISGMIGDNYDVSNFNKEIKDYKYIGEEGNLLGNLKKENINIKYLYAKDSIINVNYIDSDNGNKIIRSNTINGFEGNEIDIQATKIKGYSYNNNKLHEKMKAGTYDINFYYTKLNKENEAKKKVEDATTNIAKINIVSKDIKDDKILRRDSFTGEKGKKIKIKLKGIEGYTLITDNFNNEFDPNKKKEETIIDELLSSISKNSNISNEKNKKDNVKSEYEIVMNCDDSEYIIYYKK